MAKLFENNTPAKPSPVTFIIGNGFDLGLNMKTSYSDVYDTYVKTSSATTAIKLFKEELSRRTKYDKWSDFEMGMADYAATLSSEAELIECVRDFKSHMVQHLQSENRRMLELIREGAYATHLIKELDRSFEQFHFGFAPNVRNQLSQLIGDPFQEHHIITFNYTQVIEALFSVKARHQKVIMKPPLHIHGSLDKDVVLGVDNITQLQNSAYGLTRKGERAFVKTLFNEQYDSARVAAAKKLISDSTVICTYGFSMGESDKTWVDLLIDWLRNDVNHHLVVYQYDTTEYGQYNFDVLMDTEDEKKEKLMRKLGIKEKSLFDQIHIPVGYDIFNFKFVKIEGAKLANPPFNIFETYGR